MSANFHEITFLSTHENILHSWDDDIVFFLVLASIDTFLAPTSLYIKNMASGDKEFAISVLDENTT